MDDRKKPDKEISIPLLYPQLRQQPKPLLLKKQSVIEISKLAVTHHKKKNDSIFSVLYKSADTELIKNRSKYLTEVSLSNKAFFPPDVFCDKCPKKVNKKTVFEHKRNDFLNQKRKPEEKNKKQVDKRQKNEVPSNKDNLIEIEDFLKRKDSLYFERNRRDSLDILDYRINNYKNMNPTESFTNQQQNNDKIIQDEESVVEEKSDDESFNEYDQNSEDMSDNDNGGDGGYSDY